MNLEERKVLLLWVKAFTEGIWGNVGPGVSGSGREDECQAPTGGGVGWVGRAQPAHRSVAPIQPVASHTQSLGSD